MNEGEARGKLAQAGGRLTGRVTGAAMVKADNQMTTVKGGMVKGNDGGNEGTGANSPWRGSGGGPE